MYVSKGTITETFKLDNSGEHWFKKGEVDEPLLNQFLLPEVQNPNWSKGIPINFIRKEWKIILVLIKNYISCEGRYNLISRFHIKFQLHMTEHAKINLPFFIIKRLHKMSEKVQKFRKVAMTSLAHPCLITALVYHELCCNRIDENLFLVDVSFDLKPSLNAKDKERRLKKNAKNDKGSTKQVSKPEGMIYVR